MSFDAFQSSAGSSSGGVSGVSDVGATSSAPPVPEHDSSTSSAPTPEAAAPAPQKVGEARPVTPAATPALPEWTPNWKFKVMDKEHEIPENFRGIVKTADEEKAVREIFEKAYGLEHVKGRHTELQKKFQDVNTAHTQIQAGIQELRQSYQKGDFDSFFQRLQIPEEKILQWVINKAQYNQLPPEQRKVLDEKRSAETKADMLERQTQQYQQMFEAQATQAKAQGLQFTLERPEVKTFAQSFDERAGQPGAFQREVIKYGEYAFYASKGKTDLTPEQAVQQVMAQYGKFVQAPAAPQVQHVEPPQAPARPVTTIPNLAGRGASSAVSHKPKFRSLDDLKAHAKKMGA